MSESTSGTAAKRRRAAAPRRKSSAGYVVQRRFRFNGVVVEPGQKPPVEVFSHPRFETLVSTGLLRMVPQ